MAKTTEYMRIKGEREVFGEIKVENVMLSPREMEIIEKLNKSSKKVT